MDEAYRKAVSEMSEGRSGLDRTGFLFDLDARELRQKPLVRILNNICPEWRMIEIIHVGGTSGKGSTAHYIASGLSLLGPTGLLVSPHVYDYAERIKVDMADIPHRDVAEIWNDLIKPESVNIGHPLTFVETALIMAMVFFTSKGVRRAVIEVGMGGRSDPTSIVKPTHAVITNIGKDHTHLLGEDVLTIAREKAGIIKLGSKFWTAERDQSVLNFLEKRCLDAGAPLHQVVRFEDLDDAIATRLGATYYEDGRVYFSDDRMLTVRPHAPGAHQVSNAALAAAILRDYDLIPNQIEQAIERVRIPGRFETIDKDRLGSALSAGGAVTVVADMAHNPMEMQALVDTLTDLVSGRRKGWDRKAVLVVGVAREKDRYGMLRPLDNIASEVIFTKAAYRGEDPVRLQRVWNALPEHLEIPAYVETPPEEALEMAVAHAIERGTHVIVTGSTFLVDELFNPSSEMRDLNKGK